MKKTIYVLLLAMLVLVFAVSCNPEQEEKVEVGGTIERGKVTWKVLKIDGSKALVISEKILTTMKHLENAGNLESWNDSLINKWLNDSSSDGFIAQYGLGDVSIAQVGDVNGKVFLLTKTEAETYFSDNASRAATNLSGEASGWWLASQNSSPSYYDNVDSNGAISSSGTPVHYEQGVRPALWINL